jgi:aryl-alcohol dehydrogenase-like predicted oxidoreductase
MSDLFSPNRLTLGTAQFGFNYGAFNKEGQIAYKDIVNILDYAHASGIDTLDTASGYGDSELVLGRYHQDGGHKYNIITKMHKNISAHEVVDIALKRLQVEELDGLLFHNYDLYRDNPHLLQDLISQKNLGRIQKVGFSLYYPEDLHNLLDSKIPFDIVQLQYSVFDQRFAYLFPVLAERGIEIHTRSVFLQGLYFADPAQLGKHFDSVKNNLVTLQQLGKKAGLSVGALCLNFALENSYIDKVIIGVNNLENLRDNMNCLEHGRAVQSHTNTLKGLHIEDINILFPHFWK